MPDITLPSSVRAEELLPAYRIFHVEHPKARARVAEHGAHLMEWTPTGCSPVFYLSPQAVFLEGKAIRGGMPICWPWFGPHETDSKLPAHGFVRNRFWQLTEATESNAGVTLELSLADNARTRALWPHAFSLRLQLFIGASLQARLLTTNNSEENFTITAALHSYLAVGDIGKVSVEGLDGAEYRDHCCQRLVHRQSGNISFTGEIDRDYESSAEVRVHDATNDRYLIVNSAGSRCTVVWNPWIEKARSLSDLPDEDYLRFVCIETANAWRDVIEISPGQCHELTTHISVAQCPTPPCGTQS